MSAPKGNKFFQLRSKHGRDKLFETPELMWEAALEYFQWCEKNPLFETVWKGTPLQKKKIPHLRPYTLQGLCRFLNCNSAYFRQFKTDKEKCTEAFNTVILNIEELIYDQKFSGAASGFFNANIISRDLGLADKQETNSKAFPKC